MKNSVLILVSFITLSCSQSKEWDNTIFTTENTNLKIAFGSCAHSYDTLEIFNAINVQQPDLWIWLGDIVYGDTHDMSILREKYDRQKSKLEYQELQNQSKVIGIWDDHDYGVNDAGKYYSKKEESKNELLRFLDVESDDPVYNREGAYSTYSIKVREKLVKVFLLDTRYFRDTLQADTISMARYLPNYKGSILGEKQWNWLRSELSSSNADLHIIGSGIQLIAEEQGFEKWANFPEERQKFYQLLVAESSKTPTVVISGDRHIAELSKMDIEGLDYPLYDFTASGLTHTWGMARPEPNKHRVDSMIIAKNFGMINVDFSNFNLILDLTVFDEKGEIRLNRQLEFD